MPICTTCTNFTPYLYTVYETANNLRLEQCPKCRSFADPYVEHDSLTLLLDLILLKRGVYRHLLYNRGTEPRKPSNPTELPKAGSELMQSTVDNDISSINRENKRWLLVVRLGGTLILLDAFIRWSYLHPNEPADLSPWTKETLNGVSRVFLGCFIETLAFHLGIMLTCYVVLQLVAWIKSSRNRGRSTPESDIQREFRFSLIPLTLLYSSLTKLFLLFLLTIWRPTSVSSTTPQPTSPWSESFLYTEYLSKALEVFDDEQIGREWVIRNVLGGMSAGFGLRVILDMHPVFTSIIILAGWKAKTVVAGLVSGWVGGDEMASEAWRAYSIP